MKTIYVKRSREDRKATREDERYVDLFGDDFIDVARKLGVQK
jgi:hypothetical protein